MDKPNPASQESQEDEFSQRARKSRYPDYLAAFSMFASGGTVHFGTVPAALDQRLVWALAAQDAKSNGLRNLVDFEDAIERLRKTTAEAPDASGYGGAEADSNLHQW